MMRLGLLSLAICILASAVLAQTPGNTIFRPGVTDSSLINHQPWSDNDLLNPSGYKTLTPSGGGADSDTAQVQAALDNSATIPVMLKGGQFDVCHTLNLPYKGILVAENSIPYDPFNGTTANAWLQCSGTFTGTAYVRRNPTTGNGNAFGFMRGVAVDDNYVHRIEITGSISGTTLTVSAVGVNNLNPGLVPWMDIRDATGHLAANTKITSQTSGTPGGVGVYEVLPSQSVASESMAGVIHCVEHYGNASFTQAEDLYLVRCTGDGYSVVADINKPGGQGDNFGNGALIRPIIHGGYFSLNDGSGLNVGTYGTGSFASDLYVDRQLNAASNANNAFNGISAEVRIFGSTGVLTDLRTEFGPCGLVISNSDAMLVNHFFSDNDTCFLEMSNASGTLNGWAFQRTTHGSSAILLNAAFLQFNDVFVGTGGSSYATTVQADSGSSLSGSLAAPVYADATTEAAIAPNITRSVGGNPPQTITLTGASFAAPDLYKSNNSVFALSHAGCAGGTGGHCSIPNPSIAPAHGMQGVFEIQQSITGNDTVTWGGSYVNPPTLSTGGGDIDYVPWYISSSGSIVLEAPNQNRLVTTPIAANPNLLSVPFDIPMANVAGGTRTASVTDPDGGTNAALITEDTSFGFHGAGQGSGLSLAPGVYTLSAYYAPPTSGSRLPVLLITSSSQRADVSWDFGCSVQGDDGTGIEIGRGCVQAPNGFIRVWLTVDTTGTSDPITLAAFLFAPFPGAGAFNYTGDGTSNMRIWGGVMRAGNSP